MRYSGDTARPRYRTVRKRTRRHRTVRYGTTGIIIKGRPRHITASIQTLVSANALLANRYGGRALKMLDAEVLADEELKDEEESEKKGEEIAETSSARDDSTLSVPEVRRPLTTEERIAKGIAPVKPEYLVAVQAKVAVAGAGTGGAKSDKKSRRQIKAVLHNFQDSLLGPRTKLTSPDEISCNSTLRIFLSLQGILSFIDPLQSLPESFPVYATGKEGRA